ncbi:DUF6193 family natural product biosynthesis protein [Kitasatospora sp. NPDC004531]
MSEIPLDAEAAERRAAAAAFLAELERAAAGFGLSLPVPESVHRAGAEFVGPGSGDRAWIRAWVTDAGPVVSLHRAGATLAQGVAADLPGAVRAVVAWLAGADLAAVRRVAPFLVVHEWAFAHERAPLDEFELAWRQRLGRFDVPLTGNYPPGYRAMFEAAFAEPRLRRLAPVTSHFRLWFSSTPQHPYQPVGAHIDPLHDGTFEVRHRDGAVFAAATAEEAVALAVQGLPADC